MDADFDVGKKIRITVGHEACEFSRMLGTRCQKIGRHGACALFGDGRGGTVFGFTSARDRGVGFGVSVTKTNAITGGKQQKIAKLLSRSFNGGVFCSGGVARGHGSSSAAESCRNRSGSTAARR